MLTDENEKPAATQTTTGNTDSNNNAQQRGGNKQNLNHNNRRGLNNNRNSVQLTNHITWEGDNSEVNSVVGMKIENFHLEVPFETFEDKIMNYVISNYKNRGDMKPIFKKLEDPIKAMESKHNPKSLENAADQIEKDIQRERIKQFVSSEYVLRSNMEKLYDLLRGQCSSALQVTIKGISEYEDKSNDVAPIWLLIEIKKAISGIDLKANPRLTLHEAVSTLYIVHS